MSKNEEKQGTSQEKAKALQVGQSVEKFTSFGQRGTLVEKVNEQEWVVQMGIIKMKVPLRGSSPIAEARSQATSHREECT